MQDLEQVIRERAYLLWMEGGCQDGQAAVHWLAAQREILGASLGEVGLVKVGEQYPAAKSPKPNKAKATRKKRAA
jgi:Protein of unknown function (DUF2934)